MPLLVDVSSSPWCLPGVDAAVAALRYDPASRRLVAGLKYRGNRAVVGWLVDRLAPAVLRHAAVGTTQLTWAPTSPARRRARGYDQAEELARALGRRTGLPARRLLRRQPGPGLTGRNRSDRVGAVAFVALRPCAGTVVVVDDVVTTGTTLRAAAATLRAAGADRVVAAVAARVPPS